MVRDILIRASYQLKSQLFDRKVFGIIVFIFNFALNGLLGMNATHTSILGLPCEEIKKGP